MESGQNPEIETITPGAQIEATQFVDEELKHAKTSLKVTQIGGVTFMLIVMLYMGSLTNGFASAMQPPEAANIAKGMIDERVNDNLPQFKQYLREKLPTFIAEVPNYAKKELPNYRVNLENQLAKSIDDFSQQTAGQFSDRVDSFLNTNQGAVGGLINVSQDPQAMSAMDNSMRQMFMDYLGNTQLNGETLKSKVDKTLESLTDIDNNIRRLAVNKNLTDQEKKTRKAIAVLMKTVDEDKAVADAQTVVTSLKQTDATVIPAAMEGQLSWTDNGNEAIFTAPGKPPMHFIRKEEKPVPKATPKPQAKPLHHGN